MLALIEILPDPTRPLGGGAVIRVQPGTALPDPVPLAVFDRSRNRWLGDRSWQQVEVRFGPYPLRRTADGEAEFTVGSEIVDYIEEYTALTLKLGDVSGNADWPDTIQIAPGAPPLSSILSDTPTELGATVQGARWGAGDQPRLEPLEPGTYDGRIDTRETGGGTGDAGGDTDERADDETGGGTTTGDPDPLGGSRRLSILMGVLGAALMAGLLWYFLVFVPGRAHLTDGGDTTPPPPPLPVLACDRDSLLALGDFAAARARLAECGTAVDPNTAFTLLERAAGAGAGEALMAFARLYDGAADDDVFKTGLGLGYGERLDLAARYYARARDAGAPEAAAALAATCERIAQSTDALVTEAARGYCE